MCMAGWGKHWTRRCQGWNCFENRFCLHRTRENSREKYSMKEHLLLSLESNKHFPFGVDSKGPYFLLFIQRPSHTSVWKGVWYTEIQYQTEATSMAVLTPQVMILGRRQIIPWKQSIADVIKSWPKGVIGVWQISALSLFRLQWAAAKVRNIGINKGRWRETQRDEEALVPIKHLPSLRHSSI